MPCRRSEASAVDPRHRPDKRHADKAYSSAANRAAVQRRHTLPRLARKGIESKERLGRYR